MKPVAVVASAAISALGRGRDAVSTGEPGAPPRDGLSLVPGIANIKNPLFARVELPPSERDPAEQLLGLAALELTRELEQNVPEFGRLRCAALIGTSSGAMQSIESALKARAEGRELTREAAERASYFAPLEALERVLPAGTRVLQIHAACASSTLAIGLACRLLETGEFELVIAGGYDALSALVASGFDALGALTRGRPRPYREGRDGMALGEGAALLALRLAERAPGARSLVLGFGASSDAHHVTAPHPEGAGLERALWSALEDARVAPDGIELVSAHGTGTVFNDAAEAHALTRVFGARALAASPLTISPLKAVLGHTLGAAGALETLGAFDALARQCAPGVPGEGPVLGDGAFLLPARNTPRELSKAVKLSAAFGGSNAVLVLADAPEARRAASEPGRASSPLPANGAARARHAVACVARGPFVDGARPELVARFARVEPRILERLDGLSELAVAAVAALLETLEDRPGSETAVVLGSVAATLEHDEAFDRKRRAGLALEPRRFPATSPNLAPCWCSIAFGYRATAFALGGSAVERDALGVAHDLVALGDAQAAFAVVAEDVGPAVRDLFRAAGRPVPVRGAQAVLLARTAGPGVSKAELAWGPAR